MLTCSIFFNLSTQILAKDLIEQRVSHLKTDYSKLIFRDSEGSVRLTVGKKEFYHIDDQVFNQDWLKQYDCELEPLKDILFEFSVSFPPTYPFEEDPQFPHHYMSTRFVFRYSFYFCIVNRNVGFFSLKHCSKSWSKSLV